MPEENVDNDLERLVAAHLDDALDAESSARLHQHLRNDVQARRLLLAAAVQASTLPRIALEDGLARSPVSSRVSTRSERFRPWFGVLAASLLIAVALWLTFSSVTNTVRIDGASGLTVERAGTRHLSAIDPWLHVGDRVVVDGGPARLSWTTEGTSLELISGTRVLIEALGANKIVRVEQGGLSADVAPQPHGSGLAVVTPFGSVHVIGTRFTVAVHEHTSSVVVEHGSVRVTAARGLPATTLQAGYVVAMDGATVSTPAPVSRLPSASSAAVVVALTRVRMGVDGFRTEAGWEGDLVGNEIRGVRVSDSRVTRITTPLNRPDGYMRFGAGLHGTLRVSVDQPTTLAFLLVCDHPDGGAAWVGNLQCERAIPAGEQDITVSASDFHQVTAGAAPAEGSRIVAAAVMSWGPAADLRLQWIELSR